MKKNILILGGGIDQIIGIKKAQQMGLYTIVLDGNENAPAKNVADEFYTVSIKHIQQIKEFIFHTLDKKIDGVIAFGVDIAYIIAQTANILQCNHTIPQEAAALSEDKFQSKEFMKNLGISIPPYAQISSYEEAFNFIKKYGFDVVIKPKDNSAARGISYINSLEQLSDAISYAKSFSKSQTIQIEKYFSGPQISSESFVINGKVHNIAFLDRNYSNQERFFPNIIEDGGNMPSQFMLQKHKNQLHFMLQKIVDALQIKNGIIKGDLVIHNDTLYIIEFALRLSGGNFSTVCIPASTGVDFLRIALDLHLNVPIDKSQLNITKDKPVTMRYKFVEDLPPKQHGKLISSIIMPQQTPSILAANMHIQPQQQLPLKTTSHASRLGFVVTTASTISQSQEIAQNFLDKVVIQ